VRFIAIFLLFFATNAFAAGSDPEMIKVVNAFYDTYLAVKPSGVPSGKEQRKFKPFLSDSLAKLLNEATRAEEKYHWATKGEVPPIVEGDIFTSLFEGATAFEVLSCDAATGSCLVEFSYVDAAKGPPAKWKDKIYFVGNTSGWLINDIEYLGEWQFMHKGRLQDLLKEVVKEGNENP
jgi:hypothetical protein